MADYFLSDDQPWAESWAQVMWDIIRPAAQRSPADDTDRDALILVHPGQPPNEGLLGTVRIRVETAMPVHATASQNAADAILQPFIDNEDVTVEERDAVRAAILAAQGGTIDWSLHLPAYFLATTIDDATMTTQGWFAES